MAEGKNQKKPVEIPIAEEIAALNLNEATRANVGNPYFATQLAKAPKPLKVLFGMAAFLIIMFLVLGALLSSQVSQPNQPVNAGSVCLSLSSLQCQILAMNSTGTVKIMLFSALPSGQVQQTYQPQRIQGLACFSSSSNYSTSYRPPLAKFIQDNISIGSSPVTVYFSCPLSFLQGGLSAFNGTLWAEYPSTLGGEYAEEIGTIQIYAPLSPFPI